MFCLPTWKRVAWTLGSLVLGFAVLAGLLLWSISSAMRAGV